jgi:hypothetical protein
MPKPYTPYTLNQSALPYGLWIDIPFRKRGSTAVRSDAKRRGARFCPAAKGKIKWWMPRSHLSVETVNWLNANEMIRGERKAPAFDPNALKVSDIDLSHPFRIYLHVPFADKDTAKAQGALWSADERKWYFNATNLTPQRFDEMLKREWVFSFHGHIKGVSGITCRYFRAEDNGSDAPDAPPPFVSTEWVFFKDGGFVTMQTLHDGRIALASDHDDFHSAIYTKDAARSIWNVLIAEGWVLKGATNG